MSVVAAVVDGDGVVCGTAFVVADDAALTCRHVLDTASKAPLGIRRIGSNLYERVIGTDIDDALDLALLRVAPRPGCARLVIGSAPTPIGLKVASHGFPYDHPVDAFPAGLPVSKAVVAGEADVDLCGQRARLMVLDGERL